ncbi:MAG: DUF2723 domain-containing protein [Prevotellaceae bacterium]|jgi:hypothetical protein|nr:DUF2723 domain-containing protein [Prevotellaceae bacterium]
MKKFRLIETITGWAVFAIAAAVYLMTIEPSASFWDCGEFIASADKLEVGHPPGAPFFILMGRVFAIFAEPASVAKMINSFSALCSAFTILFLFWTITHLARKIAANGTKEFSTGSIIAIIGAGAVGALAYTFSDTFWFSAVEGEVYAFSSFFTAIVFWCILRWEDAADKGNASRWLILIAYLMGLSIGVHLLNLLAIPAIVLVYFFKKKTEITVKSVIVALVAAVVILGAVQYGLIPGFTKVAGIFELFFVNTVGMSFNSGLFIYLLLVLTISIWAVYESHTLKNDVRTKISSILLLVILGVPFLGSSLWIGLAIIIAVSILLFSKIKINLKWVNTMVMCTLMIVIGYSSYAMIMVRSAANPPMDQNSPEDVFSLQSYLNREQYGDRPLIYGASFNAPPKLKVEGGYCKSIPIYGSKNYIRKSKQAGGKDEYIVSGRTFLGLEKDSKFNMLFPRMFSDQPQHVDIYKEYVKGQTLTVDMCGRPETRIVPTFAENLTFFFQYQFSFMYWRYFMWNFAGRQNDIQSSNGELDAGNWISGIPFIDNTLYGDQSKLPDWLKENKGYNRYYFLPLLLGIFGLLWQLASSKKGKQQFWITFTLFFMTGIAIVMYLNQTPLQPRERDYAYAGSFYAFCIWIGLGVMAIVKFLNEKVKLNHTASAVVAALVSLAVPALMGCENWNDHDRSERYLCRDIGYDYLNSCKKNAILFCNGDNDTFPLWYNQEVEGVRPDIRSCNLSYISASWYIDQMKRGYYDSAPLQIDWDEPEYQNHHLEAVTVSDHPAFKGKMDLNEAFRIMRDPEFISSDGYGNIFASTVTIPVDKQKVIAAGVVAPEDYDKIVDTISIKLGKQLGKNDLMVLEMLRNNDWTRPLYFCVTVGSSFYPNIQTYLQNEGMAHRFVPIAGSNRQAKTDILYDNVMNKFRFGNASNPKIYIDETNRRTCQSLRSTFAQLAESLIRENKMEQAKQVLDKGMKEVPETAIPYDWGMITFVDSYFKAGEAQKAEDLLNKVVHNVEQNIQYVISLPVNKQDFVSRENSLRNNMGILQQITMICNDNKSAMYEQVKQKFDTYYSVLASRLQQ